MSCAAGDAPCQGVISLETAAAIKPYATRPKAKARVADVAYAIPAGTTKLIKARVYGPALAQAIKTHRVTLRLTAWESGVTTPVATQVHVTPSRSGENVSVTVAAGALLGPVLVTTIL